MGRDLPEHLFCARHCARGEQLAIWVCPGWFLAQEQLRKKLRLTIVGVLGQALAVGGQEPGGIGILTQYA